MPVSHRVHARMPDITPVLSEITLAMSNISAHSQERVPKYRNRIPCGYVHLIVVNITPRPSVKTHVSRAGPAVRIHRFNVKPTNARIAAPVLLLGPYLTIRFTYRHIPNPLSAWDFLITPHAPAPAAVHAESAIMLTAAHILFGSPFLEPTTGFRQPAMQIRQTAPLPSHI